MFLWFKGKFMTFPREGKFTLSHFLASKMLWVRGRGSFRKGVRVRTGVPGGGVCGRVQGGDGGGARFFCGK